VNFLAQLAHVVLPSMLVLYAGYRYGWDAVAVGLAMSGFGLSAMIVQGGLTGPVVRARGERATLLIGLAGGAAGMIISGLASTSLTFVLAIPVTAVWGLAGSAAQGLMTRAVGAREQGQLQGANNSVQALAQLAGPSMFTMTFAYFISGAAPVALVGAPFLLAAVLLVASLVIAAIVTRERGLTRAGGTP
jgi:DHA1 family tetracycline resistance protein-like MFS transporter